MWATESVLGTWPANILKAVYRFLGAFTCVLLSDGHYHLINTVRTYVSITRTITQGALVLRVVLIFERLLYARALLLCEYEFVGGVIVTAGVRQQHYDIKCRFIVTIFDLVPVIRSVCRLLSLCVALLHPDSSWHEVLLWYNMHRYSVRTYPTTLCGAAGNTK